MGSAQVTIGKSWAHFVAVTDSPVTTDQAPSKVDHNQSERRRRGTTLAVHAKERDALFKRNDDRADRAVKADDQFVPILKSFELKAYPHVPSTFPCQQAVCAPIHPRTVLLLSGFGVRSRE